MILPMRHIRLNHLRQISMLEGISYLLLVGIGMPLKYGFAIGSGNKFLGMTHGLLTLVFIWILGHAWLYKRVSTKIAIGVFVASLVPCGAFIAEKKLKQIARVSKIA